MTMLLLVLAVMVGTIAGAVVGASFMSARLRRQDDAARADIRAAVQAAAAQALHEIGRAHV